jgi:hypothetical protein
MSRIAIILGFAIACVLSLTLPERALAQETFKPCGLCSDYSCEDGLCHSFAGFGGATFDCSSASGCHGYFVTGICYDNHGRCRTALNSGVEKVISALERSDLRSLRTAMTLLGDKAVLNPADRSIDVFSCGPERTLFARLPASEATLAALAPVRSTALRE